MNGSKRDEFEPCHIWQKVKVNEINLSKLDRFESKLQSSFLTKRSSLDDSLKTNRLSCTFCS